MLFSMHVCTIHPIIEGAGIDEDSLELSNLWDNPDYKGVKAELIKELLIELTRSDRLVD